MTGNKPEILAPCGNMTSLKAAIAAGADACYLAGNSFGARAYADNFSETELLEAIDIAHLHDVKIYLTANTLVKENEMYILKKSLIPLYEAGLDAVLVQDFGVLRMIKKEFPELPIHTSTQMNITSPAGALLAKKLGAERVVAAREMTIEELAAIKKKVDIELEAFVHGAMCFCYSGRCYYSSMAGGRSGNRGRCAQPCRQKYNGSYVMSMRDMCTIHYVPELIEAGVDSLKIEGRMKNEYYTAAAVDAYKQMVEDYFDGCFTKEKADKYEKRLLDTFNRGGFTSGYLRLDRYDEKRSEKLIDSSMPGRRGVLVGSVASTGNGAISFKTVTEIYEGDEFLIDSDIPVNITCNKRADRNNKITLNAPETRRIKVGDKIYRTRCKHLLADIERRLELGGKVRLSAKVGIKVGERLELKLWLSDDESYVNLPKSCRTVTVLGDVIQEASSKPVSDDSVREKLSALGNTIFEFDKLDIENDGRSFVPVSVLKGLRRQGLDEISDKIISFYKRNIPHDDFVERIIDEAGEENEEIHIAVSSLEQLRAVLNYSTPDYIYLDMGLGKFDDNDLEQSIYIIREKESGYYVNSYIILALPYINRCDYKLDDYVNLISMADGIYIRCIDDLALLVSCSEVIREVIENKTIILASSLYAYNSWAVRELVDMIQQSLSDLNLNIILDAPLELTSTEAEMVSYPEGVKLVRDIYGRLPLMVTDALGSENVHLKDDQGRGIDAISSEKLCYSVILGDVPLSLHEYREEIKSVRYNFTTESYECVKDVLSDNPKYIGKNLFTRGHYRKGIL